MSTKNQGKIQIQENIIYKYKKNHIEILNINNHRIKISNINNHYIKILNEYFKILKVILKIDFLLKFKY